MTKHFTKQILYFKTILPKGPSQNFYRDGYIFKPIFSIKIVDVKVSICFWAILFYLCPCWLKTNK